MRTNCPNCNLLVKDFPIDSKYNTQYKCKCDMYEIYLNINEETFIYKDHRFEVRFDDNKTTVFYNYPFHYDRMIVLDFIVDFRNLDHIISKINMYKMFL